MRSVVGASRELELLVQFMPSTACLIKDNGTTDVQTEALRESDHILIKPGEKIAADGLVKAGNSYLDESMLTGESKPVQKAKGQKVIAGSVNGNGSLKVRVTHSGKDSYLIKVVDLMLSAQEAKSNTQLLADKAARWMTMIALLAGITTFVVWISLGRDIAFTMERMVTVMVICCPLALGLAVPLVVAKSTALLALLGLLIKNRNAFENSRKITVVIFDNKKTRFYSKKRVFNEVRPPGLEPIFVISLLSTTYVESQSSGA